MKDFETLFGNSPSNYSSANVGTGLYSTVCDSDVDPNIVIKSSGIPGTSGFSDGWVLYALEVMNSKVKYPWMPKIHYMVVDFNNYTVECVMERLDEQDYDNPVVMCGYVDRMIYRFCYSPHISMKDADTLSKFWTHMMKTYDVFNDMRLLYFDGHRNNWMMRGDQIVLIDPLNYVTSSEIHVDPDSKFTKFINKAILRLAKRADGVKVVGA